MRVYLLLVLFVATGTAWSASVGMQEALDSVVLPGSELRAKPATGESPVVLRVVATYPHGDAMRYDLVYYGLEPGSYNLADYLERSDGTPASGLPPIPIEIVPTLPPGQVLPTAPPSGTHSPEIGGYRTVLYALGAIWILGFVLFFITRKRGHETVDDTGTIPSPADNLRPLLEKAQEGALTADEKVRLERILLDFWRGRLDLGDLPLDKAIAQLRSHDEAGKLLRALEGWLHQPGSPEGGGAAVAELLAPYTQTVR